MDEKDIEEELEFESNQKYKEWVEKNDWYQTIHLRDGIKTPGKFKTDKRIPELREINFLEKKVLDIGCNSGQYYLLAKREGAEKVVGIEPDAKRLHQAKILAANEGLEIDFRRGTLDSISESQPFDVVLCIAVLTEIKDVIGGLEKISSITSEQAFIEIGLAKPVFYLSRNSAWWKSDEVVSRLGKTAEFFRHNHAGWVVRPSLEIIRDIFSDFSVDYKGAGVRYDKLHIKRKGIH